MSQGKDSLIKIQENQYENTVIDFITKQKGTLIVLTDDQSFLTLLRMTLIKHLALSKSDILTVVQDPAQILKLIKESHEKEQSLLIFLERTINGIDLSLMVKQYKEAYPKVKTIILTVEAEKERIMFLHEIGADNFIAKPVSSKTLVEKIAFTIKPQNKLGQLIDKAKSLLQEKKYTDAIDICQKIIEAKPSSAAAYLVMGDAHKGKGDIDKAEECYTLASKEAEMYMEPLRRLSDLHAEMGNNEKSLIYLQKLDDISPLNSDRKINMGVIHLSLGHEEKAEELFEKAVFQITKDALNYIGSVTNKIAEIYADKDPLKSEKYLRKALESKGKYLSKEDINMFNQLGINLRQQGRWQDAIVEYNRALKIVNNDENLYYNMAMAYAEGKDFESAKVNMTKALTLNPEFMRLSPNIAYNIGLVFIQAGFKSKGAEYLKISLALKPDFELAQKALAKVTPELEQVG